MTVRDPGYSPRPGSEPAPATRSSPGAGPDPVPAVGQGPVADPTVGGRPPTRGPRPSRPSWLVPALVVALVAGVGIGFGGGIVGSGLTGGQATPPASSNDAGVAQPTLDPAATQPPGNEEPVASGEPAGSPAPEPPAPVEADVAVVPVTNFRSGRSTVKASDVKKIAAGEGAYDSLVLVEDEADAILATLDLAREDLGDGLELVASADGLRAYLPKHRKALGFLRADDVDESVRALAWSGTALFGVDRVKSLSDWPLIARLPVAADATPYDPGTAWTMVAGGDILLDRGVALAIGDKGVDFPFNGGTVEITGICPDCSPFGWDLPYTKRTGNKGVVRDLIKGADIAIANFENPAPDNFRFHGKGTVFTANPASIKGLADAGIDWVSLANNHIGDAGRAGMLQTIKNVEKYGIAHAGLGKNTKAAHKAALLEAGGVTVGLLGYDSIAKVYAAGPDTPGSARMTKKALKADIKAARKAGADVVIVMPHWGVEYRATPSAGQRELGRYAIEAGADMVIGNHAHWAGALEVHEGKPIWYALGNFVFDQTWSIPTMQGITVELTFDGKDLVQAVMRPHLILDRAQPNFLDPLGDGKAVLTQVFRASKGMLEW